MTLALENVSYSYKTKYQTVQAVKDASCRFEQGNFYAIVGKSGSGKSTLLSLAAGLEAPGSGKVTADGENIGRMDQDGYRRDTVSVIYQNYNLFPLLTVMENVMYPLALKKIPKKRGGGQSGKGSGKGRT
jgi:ABC-type lipoprotein export system ATPase subunit